ncbi:hypothetical protein BAUCODRAFT_126699 [Baudoinia panamericana UAMH 10762]|uniref:Uncharacterized protein n=1 Tax=Baudoinia panamericana (strain UAMH 10762) TaxID=717646 RepID=M2M510_BAUPA|nr:uncharacterized protein BAUCODRAFT_126699 [Baudoinia panamericana UAMH 10762]EMC91701.1 hypothetical protein BAUCODRAFT_126699 [Baudoinia panamericana UAMH 10762]
MSRKAGTPAKRTNTKNIEFQLANAGLTCIQARSSTGRKTQGTLHSFRSWVWRKLTYLHDSCKHTHVQRASAYGTIAVTYGSHETSSSHRHQEEAYG